ncbi:hypothetical protein Tco_0732130 [Tanacetum coccineum]
MSGFLWCQGDMKRGKAKVSWEDVCLPKQEGGLGIRRLENFNVALMSTHVWKIVTRKDSLWVKWIHAYKLKKRSFLDVKMASNVSWGWRKLLQIRSILRPHFWHELGNGRSTSAWFDTWDTQCPLMNLVSYRAVTGGGFNMQECVNDIISDGVDKLQWKAYDGSLKDFSCREVWFTIRERGSETECMGVAWDIENSVDLSSLRCLLCKSQQDSHEHLFFECAYSSSVWQNVLNVAGISGVSSQWDDIMLWLLPISKSKTVISIVGRLIVAATSYFLWREQNDRIHGKGDKKVEQVSKYVADSVRLKLASIKFKKNARV